MDRTNEELKQAICGFLDGRKLSLRQARTRTGVDIDTLSRMRAGEVPRMDKVIQFARGFGLDPNDLLEKAGYGRLDEPRSNRDRLATWVLEMAERYPRAASQLQVCLQRGLESLHRLSDEEFATMLREDEALIRARHEAARKAEE